MAISSWRIGCLIPSFKVAYLLSMAVLVLFILWICLDCSFRWIPWLVGQDLQLRFLNDPSVREMHQWDYHGLRMLIFAVLAVIGLGATVVVFFRLVFGTETERSIKSMLFVTALVAFWVSFFVSFNQLWWLAFQYRILRYQNAMKASIAVLSKEWPTKSIDLPGLGTYVNAEREPNLLYIDGPGPDGCTNFFEGFDRIGKNDKGEFTFAVGSYTGWRVKYLNQGIHPQTYTIAHTDLGFEATHQLQRVVDWGDNWYLTYYEITVKEVSPGSSPNGNQIQAGSESGQNVDDK